MLEAKSLYCVEIVTSVFYNSAQQFLKTGEGGIIAGLIALLHNGVW